MAEIAEPEDLGGGRSRIIRLTLHLLFQVRVERTCRGKFGGDVAGIAGIENARPRQIGGIPAVGLAVLVQRVPFQRFHRGGGQKRGFSMPENPFRAREERSRAAGDGFAAIPEAFGAAGESFRAMAEASGAREETFSDLEKVF